MAGKFYPKAQEELQVIWDYTERTWGGEQASAYIHGLVQCVESALSQRHLWRPSMDNSLPNVFFIRYRHHYIFFRELSKKRLGVISVLHENMDLPTRLKQDVEDQSSDLLD